MRSPVYSRNFKKDTDRAKRRGKTMGKLRLVLNALLDGEPLPPSCSDHPLKGEWLGYRDCHIEPDWILIYKIDGDELILVRMGTHSDLFE